MSPFGGIDYVKRAREIKRDEESAKLGKPVPLDSIPKMSKDDAKEFVRRYEEEKKIKETAIMSPSAAVTGGDPPSPATQMTQATIDTVSVKSVSAVSVAPSDDVQSVDLPGFMSSQNPVLFDRANDEELPKEEGVDLEGDELAVEMGGGMGGESLLQHEDVYEGIMATPSLLSDSCFNQVPGFRHADQSFLQTMNQDVCKAREMEEQMAQGTLLLTPAQERMLESLKAHYTNSLISELDFGTMHARVIGESPPDECTFTLLMSQLSSNFAVVASVGKMLVKMTNVEEQICSVFEANNEGVAAAAQQAADAEYRAEAQKAKVMGVLTILLEHVMVLTSKGELSALPKHIIDKLIAAGPEKIADIFSVSPNDAGPGELTAAFRLI